MDVCISVGGKLLLTVMGFVHVYQGQNLTRVSGANRKIKQFCSVHKHEINIQRGRFYRFCFILPALIRGYSEWLSGFPKKANGLALLLSG